MPLRKHSGLASLATQRSSSITKSPSGIDWRRLHSRSLKITCICRPSPFANPNGRDRVCIRARGKYRSRCRRPNNFNNKHPSNYAMPTTMRLRGGWPILGCCIGESGHLFFTREKRLQRLKLVRRVVRRMWKILLVSPLHHDYRLAETIVMADGKAGTGGSLFIV